MKVIKVLAIPEYKIQVTFDDGVSGIIDLKNYIQTGIFTSLNNKETFNKVYSTGYSVAWSDDLEIDALNIYAEISGKKPEDIFSLNSSYAAN